MKFETRSTVFFLQAE